MWQTVLEQTQVIPETVFSQLKGVSLDHHLSCPRQHQLQVTGKFTAILKYGAKEAKKIFLVKTALLRAQANGGDESHRQSWAPSTPICWLLLCLVKGG